MYSRIEFCMGSPHHLSLYVPCYDLFTNSIYTFSHCIYMIAFFLYGYFFMFPDKVLLYKSINLLLTGPR